MSDIKRKHPLIKRIFTPGVIRAIALALAALAQIAVIALSIIHFHPFFKNINILLEILAIIQVLYLIESDINPVYKIPWIVVLLVVPVFGSVIYLIYGRAHYAKREMKRAIETSDICKEALASRPYSNSDLKKLNPNIAVQTDYLLRCADAPVYVNTTVKYFPLGDDMFPVMLEELEKAEHFIFMEYFIIEEGIMFDSILNILERKAEQGLDVRFMYDSFGSIMKAPEHVVKRLKKKGIRCFEFNSFRSILDSRYNNRDHRKICVIDGNVGFTGGVNLADEYINKHEVYGHWKDTAIMLEGEAVWSLTTMFLALWDTSCKDRDEFLMYEPTRRFDFKDGFVAPYTDYPLDGEPVGKNVYMNIINRANSYVYIMTPYLILDTVMISALENAAKNGIDVRIIMPGIPDKKIVFMLSQSYYDVLLKAGVRIYEYTPGFVHAKVFLSDDCTGVVGTINLDYRSLTHHFENAVWMYNTECLTDIKQDFFDTLEKCREVFPGQMKKSVFRRILMPILRLFSPMF